MEEEIELTPLQRRLAELEIRANGGSLWAAQELAEVIAAIVAGGDAEEDEATR